MVPCFLVILPKLMEKVYIYKYTGNTQSKLCITSLKMKAYKKYCKGELEEIQ